MKMRLAAASVLVATFLGFSFNGLFADDDIEVMKVRVDATDLAAVSGLDVYKWQVTLRKGQKVRVVLDVQPAEGAERRNYITREVTAFKDGEATILASFLREDRKLASVFLSENGKMEFRINWEGAAADGLTGFIANPLGEIPLGQKALQIHKTPTLQGDSRELLLLFRTEPPNGRGLQTLYPRASLRIEPAQ